MSSERIRLSRRAKSLLDLVPVDGNFIGNTTLLRRSRLGKQYWAIRKELINKGLLTRGKGRGGSVARLLGEKEPSADARKKGKALVRRETELYEPLRRWLDETWGEGVRDDGDFFEVRTTGSGRRRKRASGQWSRPDVTLVQVNSYDYLPQPILEVTTFEVKKFSDAENIRSVYETAAHSRWAQFSFLVAEVPSFDFEFSERFMSELERFNLGLILMWRTPEGWEFEENEYETARSTPDPKELNTLLKYFFDKDEKRLKEFRNAIGKG